MGRGARRDGLVCITGGVFLAGELRSIIAKSNT